MNIRIQSEKTEAGEEGPVGIALEKVGTHAQEEGLGGLGSVERGAIKEAVKDAEGLFGKRVLNLPAGKKKGRGEIFRGIGPVAENLLKKGAGLGSQILPPFDTGKVKESPGPAPGLRKAVEKGLEKGCGLGEVVAGGGPGYFKEGVATKAAGVGAVENTYSPCIGGIITAEGGETVCGEEEAGGGAPRPALTEGGLGALLGKFEDGGLGKSGALPVGRPGVSEEGEKGRCGEAGGREFKVLEKVLQECGRKGGFAAFPLIEPTILKGCRGKGPGEAGAGAYPGEGMPLEGDGFTGLAKEEGKLFAGIAVYGAAAGGNLGEGGHRRFVASVAPVVGALEIGHGGL